MDKIKIVRYTTVCYHSKKEGIEAVRVLGKWLSINGFQIGDSVKIEILKPGQLLLTNESLPDLKNS